MIGKRSPGHRLRSGFTSAQWSQPADSAVYVTFIFERKEHYVDSKRG